MPKDHLNDQLIDVENNEEIGRLAKKYVNNFFL